MNSSKISKFINAHIVEGAFQSHVSLIKKNRYQFNREQIEELWDIYCKTLIENEDEILDLGLAEKPQQYLPVLVDVDIKILEDNLFLTEGQEHIYTEEQLLKVVEVYQTVLRNILDECTDENLLCVVLEKPIYSISSNSRTYYKNGFHLTFPNCFLNKVDQEVHLIPRVKDMVNKLNIFDDLVGADKSGDLIDTSCCSVHWLMYGCRKDPKMDPYLVTKIINSEGNEVDLEEAFKYYKIYNSREQLIDIRGRVKEYLPRILSIIPYGRSNCELKNGLVSPMKQNMTNKKEPNKKYLKVSVIESLKISKKLLSMIATFRAEDFNEWMTIGWCLYNIGEGSPEALEQWIEFSSRDEEKFDENVCIYKWERMKLGDLTIGTLHHYAQLDNKEMYEEFKKESSEDYIKNSLEGSHYDIAKILHTNYCTEFVCTSVANRTWYQFINHKWKEIEEGIYLREKISSEIVEIYNDMHEANKAKLANCDKSEEAMYRVKNKQLQKIISNLKSATYKVSVMKEAADLFYNEKFKHKLDTDPYLIAFKNGVYDLKLNLFRNGKPEDYLSKCLPVNYTLFSDVDEKVLAVNDFFEKIFPDTSLRKYFLDQASDIFVGGNPRKIVLFFLGEGDNGKSVTQTVFEKLLGDLSIKISTTLLTGKKASIGAAGPELARAGGGVRLLVLEEPEGGEELNNGIFKSLSGNDSYWARDLFEKGKNTKEIVPLFKLWFIGNVLPSFRHSDKATWNRTRVIPFETTFVRPGEPCPETYEEQLKQKRFPMDMDFTKKIPGLLEAFAWFLLEHRKNITTRFEPEKVLAATELYKKQNDFYYQFTGEVLIECKGSSISLMEIWSAFKDWYKDSYTTALTLTKNNIKDYFVKIWGEPSVGGVWKGYRVKTEEDDIRAGKAIVLSPEDLVSYD
jgi:P4 family phage/plasmid primase-like protien